MELSRLKKIAENFDFKNPYFQERDSKYEDFLQKFPVEKLKDLTLEEYADTFSRDCFIYWLERKLGGIGGGNASKFGIYRNSEGGYSKGSGSSKIDLERKELESEVKEIMSKIDEAIGYVRSDDIDKLNKLDLPIWPMVLSKILFSYFPEKFLDISLDSIINTLADDLGVEKHPSFIVTNFYVKKKLAEIEPFSNWNNISVSEFIWETYNPIVSRNYYVIGSKYGGTDDVYPQMLKESVISMGFADQHDLSQLLGSNQSEIRDFTEKIGESRSAYLALKYFLNLKAGDWIAVKADGSPKGKQPFLSIIGLAEVVDDEDFYKHDPKGLGQMIKVKFLKPNVYKEFPLGGYGATMHKIKDPKHIDAIFYSDYEESDDERSLLIKSMIRRYKDLIKVDGNKNELYKWRRIKEFQEIWDLNSSEFGQLLKNLKFDNLIYQHTTYLFRNAEQYQEEARNSFEILYDEERDLHRRIDEFQEKAKEIFRNHMPGKKPTQDERAISTYLTFRFPEKYTFYKSSYYEKYVTLLDERKMDPGKKYIHYLNLIAELKESYILKDKELQKLSKSTLDETCYKDPKYNILAQDILFRLLDQTDFYEEYMQKGDEVKPEAPEDIPLNLILYGPPGTGKTYMLKNRYFDYFTSKQASKTKEEFLLEIAEDLSFWQAISIALLDLKKCKVQDILEHELIQAKFNFSTTKTPRATIWGNLQTHTKEDCPNVAFEKRSGPLFFWKDEKGYWTIDELIVQNESPDLKETLKSIKEFRPIAKEKRRYYFTSFHQAYGYEDFIEGIKPILSDDDSVEGNIEYSIVPGTFKKIAETAVKDPENEYAIFIDEINRGNIANIFGELITLIEEDKRLGAKNELKAILPYSKETFSVPSNLHIIGTMNTADRSVEALDTALRRRFSFRELTPAPEKISNHPDLETDLQLLLIAINQRIERLLDKDHQIGHSYFMGIASEYDPLEALKTVFADKIIPLLKEYFYGDPMKIGSILGDHFVRKIEAREITWPKGFEPDELELKEVYDIADPMEFEDESPFIAIYETQE